MIFATNGFSLILCHLNDEKNIVIFILLTKKRLSWLNKGCPKANY